MKFELKYQELLVHVFKILLKKGWSFQNNTIKAWSCVYFPCYCMYKFLYFVLCSEEGINKTEINSSQGEEPMEEDDTLRQLFVESCRSHETTDKPDHVNFRFYLWKSMRLFSDLCEKKNRDIVPLFFDFMRFVHCSWFTVN